MLNTETLVRHCLVGAHAAGCAEAELQTATEMLGTGEDPLHWLVVSLYSILVGVLVIFKVCSKGLDL